jgi:hypothetical protein
MTITKKASTRQVWTKHIVREQTGNERSRLDTGLPKRGLVLSIHMLLKHQGVAMLAK